MNEVLGSKLENLELMAIRLKSVDNHAALYLLKNCFAMPKLTYFLKLSPCFMKSDILHKYDSIIKESLTKNLNIKIPEQAWNQASLPVSKGGLGLRPAIEIALSGYLSSVTASFSIAQSLLPLHFRNQRDRHFNTAVDEWKIRSGQVELPQINLFSLNGIS